MSGHKISFYTLGCKLNFAETSIISRQFSEKGYNVVPIGAPTDVIVINSCSVTATANKKCRQLIGKLSKLSPNAKIAVIGCYAQLKPEEIASLKGVAMVLGMKNKFDISKIETLFDTECQKDDTGKIHSCAIELIDEFHLAYSTHERTRAFLKIQDGCDYRCSYCTVPLARGKSRNAPIADLVAEAKAIVDDGDVEIVITGVNIGDFGRSTGETFFELLKSLDNIEGLARVRISSCEPNLLTNEILNFAVNSKTIVPHFHIPLQSGNNRILGLMRRRYKREVFADRVSAIRTLMPNACIGADVIVGFPSETDEDFEDTYNFIQSLDINYLHVFPYSERPNTPAATMKEKVPVPIREKRCNELIRLSEDKRLKFYNNQLGSNKIFLAETIENGLCNGFTENYIKTRVKISDKYNIQTGKLYNVRLLSVDSDGCVIGEIFE